MRPGALSVRDGQPGRSPSTCRGTARCRSRAWRRCGSPSTAIPAPVRSVRCGDFAGRVGEAAGSDAIWDLRDPLDVVPRRGRPPRRDVRRRGVPRRPHPVHPDRRPEWPWCNARPPERKEPSDDRHGLTVGDPAPSFELPDVDGRPCGLDPARTPPRPSSSSPSNGCPYARAWHDRIQQVARDYADRGVTVLQIVSNDDSDHPEDSIDAMRQRVAGRRAGRTVPAGRRPVGRPGVRRHGDAGGLRARPRAGSSATTARPTGTTTTRRRTPRWLREALDDVLAGREVAPARHVARRLLDQVAGGAALVGGLPDPRRGRRAARADPRRDRQGRRPRRRGARCAPAPRRAQLGFPGSPTFAVGRPRPVPDRGAAGPHLPASTHRADGRSSPLPDTDDLAERLREVLARPWELPDWVDFRTPAPRPDARPPIHPAGVRHGIDHLRPASPSGTRTAPRRSPNSTSTSATASSSSSSARPAAARRLRCAWRPAWRRSPTVGC